MTKLTCPDCKAPAVIEHYSVDIPGSKLKILTSRLKCTTCPYTKEPKQLINPELPTFIKLLEKEEKGGGRKRGKKKDNYSQEYNQDYEG